MINTPTTNATPEATPPLNRTYTISETSLSRAEKQDCKMKRRKHRRQMLAKLSQQEDHFLKECITVAEDERTDMAKADLTDGR